MHSHMCIFIVILQLFLMRQINILSLNYLFYNVAFTNLRKLCYFLPFFDVLKHLIVRSQQNQSDKFYSPKLWFSSTSLKCMMNPIPVMLTSDTNCTVTVWAPTMKIGEGVWLPQNCPEENINEIIQKLSILFYDIRRFSHCLGLFFSVLGEST